NSDSRTFNPYLYPNQVDDYQQDHFQLHVSQRFTDMLNASLALHYTPGRGYYEEYRYDADLADYGLDPVIVGDETISETDLVRRRWLDNDFYGFTWSLNYVNTNLETTFGGGWNRYDGNHFGEIIWAEFSPVPHEYRYYFNNGDKRDFNIFGKAYYTFSEKLNGFVDLQYRTISYEANGLENSGAMIDLEKQYAFFNPKAGVTLSLGKQSQLYGSFSIANREPVRSDFINAPANRLPRHETLYNTELGARIATDRKSTRLNSSHVKISYAV